MEQCLLAKLQSLEKSHAADSSFRFAIRNVSDSEGGAGRMVWFLTEHPLFENVPIYALARPLIADAAFDKLSSTKSGS